MRLPAAILCAAVAASACAVSAPASTSSPTASVTRSPVAEPSSSSSAPLVAPVATLMTGGSWYLLPDGLSKDGAPVVVEFPRGDDVTAGRPRGRLRSTGGVVDLAREDPIVSPGAPQPVPHWVGAIPLDGAKPGQDMLEVLIRLRDGSDSVVASRPVLLSHPEYVVWTLDFEGDSASNETMDNVWDIARSYAVPMTIMWNPRVWATDQVSVERANVMAQWTKTIANVGMAEVALHLHAWTDFVRAAGVTPRTAPSWAGRGDGYDVPLTAFDESETRRLLDHAVKLMTDHGMPRPTSFRGGGLFASAANLRAVAAAGFTVDASAAPAGVFGRLPLPWTLARDAQPYRPSRDDANRAGDLPLLEVPNIAGNTYALDARTIRPTIAADLAMLAPVGEVSMTRRALTLVSHPGTVDATERAAIEALFSAFEPHRFDRGNGPLRFVTLAQLAKAWAP